MIEMNAYAASKSALEAHTLNLGRRVSGHRGEGERLPAGIGRHRDAGLDPQSVGRGDWRSATRAIHRVLRTRLITHPRAVRTVPARTVGGDATGQVWSVEDPAKMPISVGSIVEIYGYESLRGSTQLSAPPTSQRATVSKPTGQSLLCYARG